MEMENFHSFAFTVACDEELILVPKQVKNGMVQKQNTSLASPKYTEQLVKKKKNTLWPLFMDGVQLPQG